MPGAQGSAPLGGGGGGRGEGGEGSRREGGGEGRQEERRGTDPTAPEAWSPARAEAGVGPGAGS